MPKQVAAVLMFGDPLTVPIPDVDRTQPAGGARRRPVDVERVADDRPGHAAAGCGRCAAAVAGWWWSTRAPRAPHAPPTPICRSAPAPTPGCWRPWPRCCSPRASRRRADRAPSRACASTCWHRPRPRSPPRPSRPRPAWRRRRSADLAHDLAAAPSAAAVYGRIGTCTVRFGTLTSWLVDVVNILTGNLDRPGGVMFPLAVAGQRNSSPTTRPRPHPVRAGSPAGCGACRRCSASCPRPRWPKRSLGRQPARPGHHRRQPCPVRARMPADSRRRSRVSTS